jgi:hypothetical protein
MKITGKSLARCYRIDMRGAYYHVDGNWYWNLEQFPGAYFDSDGCKVFQTEKEYFDCPYLTIGPRNTGVRSKNVGMGISDIPGYMRLDPPPCTR